MLRLFRRRRATQQEAGRTAPSRRKRSRARSDRLTGLPEDILQEILARLPAKSVLRCRAVCRSWRSLASDPAILLDHHRRQPALPVIESCELAADRASVQPRVDVVHLWSADLGLPLRFPSGCSYCISASCDGLLVLGNSRICNPVTRQWATLRRDRKPVENIISLFLHRPSGEYRLLYWTTSYLPLAVHCLEENHVLTVGTNKSRRVDCSPIGLRGLHTSADDAPVLLNGSLHMHSHDVRHRIVVFDTVAETFRYMRPPYVNPRHVMHLLDMGGKLAASTSKDGMTEMAIFMLQDHEHGVWAFQYRIKLPVMEIRSFHKQGDWWAKVVSEEGDVLVSCHDHHLQCDRMGNLVADFSYYYGMRRLPVVISHRLKESLIQHPFFQKMKKKTNS